MDNETLKLFCQAFFSLARSEKKSEIIKEMLCQFEAFEPYTVFKHLTVSSPSFLTAQDLALFLQRNKLVHEENSVAQNFIRQFDRDKDGELSYSEFLQAVLPSDQPILRAIVAQREPYFCETLEEEVEYTLARLIDAEINCYETIRNMTFPEDLEPLVYELFLRIDYESSGFIDFENLLDFFKSLGFFPYEEEIIYILRRVDGNNDGRIELPDFETLFDVQLDERAPRRGLYLAEEGRSRSKSQSQKFTYYPYQPIRRCYSPVKGENPRKEPKRPLLSSRSPNPKSIEKRPEKSIEETVSKTDRPCEFAKTTLKSLRTKYSGLTPQFSSTNQRAAEEELPRPVASQELENQELENKQEPIINPVSERIYRRKYCELRERSPYSFREDHYQENFDSNIDRETRVEAEEKVRRGRFERGDAKEGVARRKEINSGKEICDFFNFVINSERKLENLKKELSLRPDFNLIDLFMFFDREKKGFCDGQNLAAVMRELRVSCKEKDLARLFSRFDRNRKGFLRFAEFCDCFCPVSKEIFEILNQRKPINNEEKFRMKELFSEETLKTVASVISFHLQNEKEQQKIRQIIFRNKSEDLGEIFGQIDEKREGFISKKQIREFMSRNGVFLEEGDAELLIERFDLDKDKRISFKEFVSGLQI